MGLQVAYRSGDHDGRPGWTIAFSFDAEKIEALKQAVPYQERSWRATEKQWWVSAEYEGVLLRLFPDFEAYLRQTNLF